MTLSKRPDRYLATEVDDELILVQAATGAFFSLKGTGLAIWHALDQAGSLNDLASRLAREYAVEEAQCLGEVRQFADQLVEAGFAEHC